MSDLPNAERREYNGESGEEVRATLAVARQASRERSVCFVLINEENILLVLFLNLSKKKKCVVSLVVVYFDRL